ncbi:MAG: hypothetical protein M1833_002029 [Piccolia ochrophora]|nr:MAG: hypothetical protein M1833_002029 [Piccolia ochrophora]
MARFLLNAAALALAISRSVADESPTTCVDPPWRKPFVFSLCPSCPAASFDGKAVDGLALATATDNTNRLCTINVDQFMHGAVETRTCAEPPSSNEPGGEQNRLCNVEVLSATSEPRETAVTTTVLTPTRIVIDEATTFDCSVVPTIINYYITINIEVIITQIVNQLTLGPATPPPLTISPSPTAPPSNFTFTSSASASVSASAPTGLLFSLYASSSDGDDLFNEPISEDSSRLLVGGSSAQGVAFALDPDGQLQDETGNFVYADVPATARKRRSKFSRLRRQADSIYGLFYDGVSGTGVTVAFAFEGSVLTVTATGNAFSFFVCTGDDQLLITSDEIPAGCFGLTIRNVLINANASSSLASSTLSATASSSISGAVTSSGPVASSSLYANSTFAVSSSASATGTFSSAANSSATASLSTSSTGTISSSSEAAESTSGPPAITSGPVASSTTSGPAASSTTGPPLGASQNFSQIIISPLVLSQTFPEFISPGPLGVLTSSEALFASDYHNFTVDADEALVDVTTTPDTFYAVDLQTGLLRPAPTQADATRGWSVTAATGGLLLALSNRLICIDTAEGLGRGQVKVYSEEEPAPTDCDPTSFFYA